MTLELIRHLLAWCLLINLGIVLWWFLFIVLAHDWVYSFHSRWFSLSKEQFITIQYGAMAFYIIGIIFLNFVPYLAFLIII